MSKAIEAKKVQVQEIADKFKNAASVVVVDYRGLNVAQVTELRKQLREAGVEFKVYKNTLTRRAVEEVGLEGLNEYLNRSKCDRILNEDVVAPAKILNNFAKENEALEIKAGVIEGNVATVEEVKALAELPSREGLLSMLLICTSSSNPQLRSCNKSCCRTKRRTRCVIYRLNQYFEYRQIA